MKKSLEQESAQKSAHVTELKQKYGQQVGYRIRLSLMVRYSFVTELCKPCNYQIYWYYTAMVNAKIKIMVITKFSNRVSISHFFLLFLFCIS